MTMDMNHLSPRTPCDMFAALALSPSCATTQPTSVPSLYFSPPTPNDPFYPSTPPPATSSPVVSDPHRSLAPNEAKQLCLLLMQHFFPVRHNPRELMRESIALASKLDQVGVRWDRMRKVMGMHLRGIWEEGQRLGNARGAAGVGAMDLYIQGSFLTIAEEPHPLDPMPIPIELNPASFAQPKLTVHAGLANSLPGVPTQFEHDYPVVPGMRTAKWSVDKFDTAFEMERPEVGPRHRFGGRGWKQRKTAGLKIQVYAPAKRDLRAVPGTPRTSSNSSSRRSAFANILPYRKWHTGRRVSAITEALPAVPLTASQGAKSARRVSFGGYEIR